MFGVVQAKPLPVWPCRLMGNEPHWRLQEQRGEDAGRLNKVANVEAAHVEDPETATSSTAL